MSGGGRNPKNVTAAASDGQNIGFGRQDYDFTNPGRKSSKRIFFITSSGTRSSGGKPASGLVASRPILALTPPGPAEGSSSLPCALGITTRPRSALNRFDTAQSTCSSSNTSI